MPVVSSVFARENGPVIREQMQALGVGRETAILNIACEYRLVPEFLADLVDPSRVYGLELNEEIAAANPNIKLCNVDEDRFPFADETFDIVLSIWGIEHFRKDNVFRESRRVLKKGGRMIFLTPNLNHPVFLFNRLTSGKISKFYYKYIIRSPYTPHPTHYRFNTAGRIDRISRTQQWHFRRVIYLGPANILEYFSYSRILQEAVSALDWGLTNRWLGFFKPYMICELEKW